MGIGSMFVVLVVAIVLLPMLVRYIDNNEPHFNISGFQDVAEAYNVTIPTGNIKDNSSMCRAPNGGDRPCEEGTFCDGPTQSCVNTYVGGSLDNVQGYYS
jgi:hypothetical protein